ncbi:ABC transporter ATP-binding protein [Pseudomonas typographi]|uniref:ABC transporter ATP-binding protein n=1 Tax=Pseudomonas typographi TaxID=2715964 RepID=A0ABR7YY52_9PSED|nr:ABC transporter ATP-binding protein [Pseudomonas typographi]MBD1550422.1 ABC transporter ATP-binding protein [Pseudomonas typographi]MBD1587901.1 ABC transporter ATP-binding protein [Pseudomonas typographi]MBD1598109.1 ABC transporter ATP-binding protein [Pseudomonas typographi]
MLEVADLRAGYKGSDAIRSVSIKVPRGQVVTVLGPNGAGKSTLINSICGLTEVHAGSIYFEGADITRLSAPDIVDLGIVQVPEGRQLFGPLTVDENLRLGFHRLRRSANRTALFKQRLDYVHELFPKLRERTGQRAVTLSGGEQSMVAMGRALMADPKVLLLDEPSIGLAPLIVELLFSVLAKLRDSGLTMLLVEQHAEESLRLAEYGYVMSTGAITAHGAARELLDSPSLHQSYLGESPALSTVGKAS